MPAGLYRRMKKGKWYFSYRDPVSGKEVGIGTDLRAATEATRILVRRHAPDPVQAIIAKIEQPVSTAKVHAEWFRGYLKTRRRKNGEPLAGGTLENYELTLKRAESTWGDRSIAEITRADVVALIETWPAETGNRARSHLNQLFTHAQARGLRNDNPVEGTIKRDVVIQRDRLGLAEYQGIFAAAEPWLQRAMRLELLSLQRPSDLCANEASSWDGERWYFRQSKSRGHGYGLLRIKPHRELKAAILDCIEHRVDDCPFLLSWQPDRKKEAKNRTHPNQLSQDVLSREFASVRNAVLPERDGTPPSFYEIKALGVRLYEEQGHSAEWIQSLAGHQDAATTRLYGDRHDNKWIDVVL